MTEKAHEIVDLTELKTAIGNLWKKVDTLQNATKSDADHLNQQVSEWTQTNLVLLRLLADLSEETQNLGKNSNELAQTSINLATTVGNLPRSLADCQSLLQENLRNAKSLKTLSNTHSLKGGLQNIKRKLAKIEQTLGKVVLSERNTSNLKAKPFKSREFSLGVVTISYVLLSTLNLWVGWQLRIWQISSDPNYKIGQTIVRWNKEQLHRAHQNNQKKSTVWIVPPEQQK